MRVSRGTEFEGVPNVIPPGQSIPSRAPRGLANQGSGSDVDTPPPPPNQDFQWAVASDGQTRNDGGAGITVQSLSTIQAALVQLGFSFPGGSSDDNQWGIPIRMPDNYDPSQPIVATLVVVQDS